MKKERKGVVKIGALLLMFLGSAMVADAQILVSDTFTLNGTTRTAGASLSGLSPETGSGTWYSNSKFGSAGTATVNATGVDTYGLTSLTNPGTVLNLQADLVTSTAGWISVGYQKSGNNSNWFDTSNSLLFALLTPGGGWQLKSNGTTAIASGTISGFTSTNSYTLDLKYNPTTGIANVLINGVDVSGDRAVTLNGTIGSAGFFIYGNGTATTTATVDNFVVTAVPEPTSLMLLLSCGLGFGVLRSRLHRS